MGLLDLLKEIKEGWEDVGIRDFTKQQSVTVQFYNYNGLLKNLKMLHRLEDELIETIDNSRVGIYDGHEVESPDLIDGKLYMFGPNAEDLYKAVKPILDNTLWLHGAQATLRFGPLNDQKTKLIDVPIGPQ